MGGRRWLTGRGCCCSTTTGQPTNMIFGFTSMLAHVLRDERPTHVAVTFDVI